jgi:hypothetical protein
MAPKSANALKGMDPPPVVALSPTRAAALARAEALTAELIELVDALRADAEPVDILAAGELRRAFMAAASTPPRPGRWADDLLG